MKIGFVRAIRVLPLLLLPACGDGGAPDGPDAGVDAAVVEEQDDFLLGVRGYPGGGVDELQLGKLAELGPVYYDAYDHRFAWHEIEAVQDADWKWAEVDAYLEVLESLGLKAFAACLYPKSPDPDLWIHQLPEDQLVEQYAEYCAAVVEHCRGRPSWAGIMKVNGTSADTFSAYYEDPPLEVYDPVRVARLVDAAYEAIKAVDPETTVVAFNQGTLFSGERYGSQWERWHEDLLGQNPRFDVFGFHGAPDDPCATCPSPDDPVQGVAGMRMIRDLLDANGHADTQMFDSEMSVVYDRSAGATEEEKERNHAINVIETIVLSRAVGLQGYVIYNLFVATNEEDWDSGLLGRFDKERQPPVLPEPRDAWDALSTLTRMVRFLDHSYEATEQGGELGSSEPWVLRFADRADPASKLWVVFSPPEDVGGETVRITVEPSTSVTQISLMGETSEVEAPDGFVEIVPTLSPTYLLAPCARFEG